LSALDNLLIADVFYEQPLTWRLCTNLKDLKTSYIINGYIEKVILPIKNAVLV